MADVGRPGSDYDPWRNFNATFTAYMIVSGVLAVFFLLYFNRVFASIVSYAIRTYTWHQYRVYIDFQALQVSLLGGRIFFTGLRYHGNNETIRAQMGHITWSYWLRRVRDVDIHERRDGPDAAASDPDRAASKLPCRLNVALSGLEWFVYNRSEAYESILREMIQPVGPDHNKPGSANSQEKNPSRPRQRLHKAPGTARSSRDNGESDKDALEGRPTGSSGHNPSLPPSRGSSTGGRQDLPMMLQLFPVHIECTKAAMVMTNENTKAVFIAKVSSMSGDIDASDSPSSDDLYRQLIKLRFEHPVVEIRENEEYREDQLARAVKEQQATLKAEPPPNRPFFRRQRRRMAGQLRNLLPYWRKSVESFSVDSRNARGVNEARIPGFHHWQGLTRYLNDGEEDDKLRWSSVEYAAVPTILDSPEAHMTLYWDAPGLVSPDGDSGLSSKEDDDSIGINGSTAPAWAIRLSIQGGLINYGPWTDRLRADLQRVFFPGISKDAVSAQKLPVGAARVPTKFNFYIELDEEVIVRVPTREDSKNWKWKKEAAALSRHRQQERKGDRVPATKTTASTAQQRPYGWLDIKVAANATVTYSMDMLAGPAGYSNALTVDLPSTEVSTSVNQELLWRSGAQRISCDLSAPLGWNTLRTWRFDIASNDMELYLLRDHIFLLVDLIDDWGSGPPAEYLTFTPFKYVVDLQLRNLKLYLNVNDANIVTNPTDFEDNTYLIVSSPHLTAKSCISLDTFRPSKNSVPFDVEAEDFAIDLHTPPWNTQATFLVSNEIGRLDKLTADGRYHYNAVTSTANTDTLELNVSAKSPSAYLYGFLVRYFLQMKDNYFGDHVHFQTLDEYQEGLRIEVEDPEAALASRPPPKKSNDLDVMLSIQTEDPRVLLPVNLFSAQRFIAIELATLSADLRFTNYYMDLDLCLSPLSLSSGNNDSGARSPMSASTSTAVFVDGINVYGHRLFGLPPTEPTYLCNWDISVGAVTGDCSVEFLTALMGGARAFAFSLDDDENSLIQQSSIVVHDVTFLRIFVASVQIWLHVEEAAFWLRSGCIDVNFNDWARTHYSKRAEIQAPEIEIACVNSDSAARHKFRPNVQLQTDAFFRTSIQFSLIGRKHNFAEARRLQQELIRHHDQRTHRTDFLLLPGITHGATTEAVDPPAQSVPIVPQPTVTKPERSDKGSLLSRATSRNPRKPGRKASFLSLSSSSSASTRRGTSLKSAQRYGSDVQSRAESMRPHEVDGRPRVPSRRYSSSTGRQSAFYSIYEDAVDRHEATYASMAFSSQFSCPCFPLEGVIPHIEENIFRVAGNEGTSHGSKPNTQFELNDVDPGLLRDDAAHQSLILELPSGMNAFMNASALEHVASLIAALQPTDPEDILDALQVSAMDGISEMQKQRTVKKELTDFTIRLPHANFRFLNSSALDSAKPPSNEQDQYDASLRSLCFIARLESNVEKSDVEPAPVSKRFSFHARLDSAEVSAAERLSGLDETQAAVKASIDRLMVSMGSGDVTYLDLDVGALRTMSSSGKIEFLAALIHRTNTLASRMGRKFSSALARGDERVQQFTYRVISEGHSASDPSFFSRPSAVLRAAVDQLRTYDSWKLIMRLRYMWFILDRATKENISFACLYGPPERAHDIKQEVIGAFEQWRSWDLENLELSILLTNIFGKPSDAMPETPTPIRALARIDEMQLILDPGPKQNQMFCSDLAVRVEETLTQSGPNAGAAPSTLSSLIMANMYCGQAGIDFNWELCELADDVLKLYKTSDPGAVTDRQAKPPQKTDLAQIRRSFHLVTVLGLGSIRLETVHLLAESYSNNLKVSALAGMDESQSLTTSSLLLSCDSTLSKLLSHSDCLLDFRLRKPSVFVGHELQSDQHRTVHTIKSTASSQDLKLLIKQDPIVLSEVLDLVIKDEVAQLYDLQKRMPTTAEPTPEKLKVLEKLSSFRVNLAMFLDAYTISVPLLRTLTYTISGIVSRATMAANFGKEIIIDFDVKENSHDMQINVNNKPQSISLLQIPPTNGRVTSSMGAEEHAVTVFASLELVQLDASAVYSLLTALNRPEISNTIDELQQRGQIIQKHVKEIFGDGTDLPATPLPSKQPQQLTYLVHGTLAGIEIFGVTPLKSDSEPDARLLFCLGSVHFEAANKLDQGPVLENPEVHINLRRILFEIEKGTIDNMRSCGNVSFGALITATSQEMEDGSDLRAFDFRSDAFQVNLSSDTVSTFVDVVGYMGDKIKDLDTSREREYLRKLRQSKPKITVNSDEESEQSDIFDSFLASITYSFEVRNIQVCWLISPFREAGLGQEDLVGTLSRIEFNTRRKKTAQLVVQDLQLQMVPPGQDRASRTLNSALLPEIILNLAYVSNSDTRRLAFQAVGKPLDLRLTSAFIVPATHLRDSINLSIDNVRQASGNWAPMVSANREKTTTEAAETRRSLFGSKRLESLLVDADFAGAVVHLSGKKHGKTKFDPSARSGKYGQFTADEPGGSSTVLRTPGLACKTEYKDNGQEDPTVHGELKVDASRNILYPSVVPLILDITSSIKEVVSSGNSETPVATPVKPTAKAAQSNENEGENLLTADPSAVLGRIKMDVGMRICRQEFTLSCQPIGRVAATAAFDDIYITFNTVHSTEHGNFFAISATFNNFQTSVQHVYSRESTASFAVESIVLSLMNSKHVSGTSGVSAILKVSPMAVAINAKQLQDFLLFREIWYPQEIRQTSTAPAPKETPDPATQGHLVQKYQQVAATAAFPWTATISIGGLDVNVDLGPSLGKSRFVIADLWVSSKKTSDWEQNLCLGFEKIGIDCTGRMSGFVALQDFKLRTSIEWPERQQAMNETPRIQASISFSQFQLKSAFDYQAFLIADITSLNFLMYNVRQQHGAMADRLVATFEGDAVQVFGTTTSASQSVALWQAVQRLINERKASYETSLRDIEKFMKRKSAPSHTPALQAGPSKLAQTTAASKSPISLDTDVVVTLKALNLGVFPSTFSDHQVFKLEASNAQARFAASMESRRVHSILGLTLGQLRIGLAGVREVEAPKSVSEISVAHVVASATGSRGGTILKVPRVEAVMQTWQYPNSRTVEYIFKSAFEGKVEVGWNYSRISYIRGMWSTHSKALAAAWGREIPTMSAIKVTGVLREPNAAEGAGGADDDKEDESAQQQKITAEVNVSLSSKYDYVALEPPIIETPQLRDMGEATPPLEWIGLNRDRLPNMTHQIVIVSLLELAGEVEDAYSKILGSS